MAKEKIRTHKTIKIELKIEKINNDRQTNNNLKKINHGHWRSAMGSDS
jgi:hypothetical protein